MSTKPLYVIGCATSAQFSHKSIHKKIQYTMKTNPLPSLSRLHELFEYRDDGVLIRKIGASGGKNARKGDIVGNLNSHGYLGFQIDGKKYLVHRIIYYMYHGHIDDTKQMDHIDGNRANNRIENLRLVTRSQNGHNQKIRKDNTSGVKGVSWHKDVMKFQARIKTNNKSIHLGLFDTLEAAEKAITEAREKIHGEYARHE